MAGVAASVALAVAARGLAGALGLGIETTLALLLGLLVGSAAPLRAALVPGARRLGGHALRAGVALLGARVTLERVLDGGLAALLSAAIVVAGGLALGWGAAMRLGIEGRLGTLIPAGMAVCGNSAILALAPVVGARDRDVAYAVSTITLFGLLGVLLLPVAGAQLGLTDAQFGTWAGLAVNDTAQVVATGFAFSDPAGDAATIVKLTRNLAIAPLVLGVAFATRGARAARASTGAAVLRAVPWFVIAFVLLAGARSTGLLDGPVPGGPALREVLAVASSWLILVALAGLGLSADARAMLRVGPRPFLLGVGLWLAIAATGLLVALQVPP